MKSEILFRALANSTDSETFKMSSSFRLLKIRVSACKIRNKKHLFFAHKFLNFITNSEIFFMFPGVAFATEYKLLLSPMLLTDENHRNT
jgi:hypothetical protein